VCANTRLVSQFMGCLLFFVQAILTLGQLCRCARLDSA